QELKHFDIKWKIVKRYGLSTCTSLQQPT
ncbi:MAG: hypothetical protein CFH40_02106, partial [Alphaproteobacteria bacterium MarineAlpha10_Bin3]